MIWDQLSSPQLDLLDRKIPVVLALAATEQHGLHLPLATDRLIGEHFAHSLHKSMSERVLVLPTVSVGCSDHHMDFAGTLSVNHKRFIGSVCDIVKSVKHHGFKKILLLNSHGGNQAAGQVIVERMGYRYSELHIVLASWWRIAVDDLKAITETDPGGTGHAGEFETSVMMLIAPHLVNAEEVKPKGNVATFTWAKGDLLGGPQASYYRSMKAMTQNGVFGEPTSASVEKGKRITGAVLSKLKEIVNDLYELTG